MSDAYEELRSTLEPRRTTNINGRAEASALLALQTLAMTPEMSSGALEDIGMSGERNRKLHVCSCVVWHSTSMLDFITGSVPHADSRA
jgi:hypothetical protein